MWQLEARVQCVHGFTRWFSAHVEMAQKFHPIGANPQVYEHFQRNLGEEDGATA